MWGCGVDIFDILTFLGGLALFLYGMNVMGGALEKQAGGRFKRVLERITSNPLSGVLLGTGITAIIQSSSATTVMVVGLVNSGILTLGNSVGVIMGANIGTAVTAWLLSLTEIDGTGSFLLQMCKPSSFSPVLAVIGICLVMGAKSDRKRDIGKILLGFAVLMFGMETMSTSVAPLQDVPQFREVLTMFSNPILGVLAGTVVTGIIQSSSASVGILQAMSATGSITFAVAIPIVMGQNIGTCVTALISSAGTNANARRAALVHLFFNILGVIVCLSGFYILNAIFDFSFMEQNIDAVGIAIVHTVFKIINTCIFLPFNKQLVRLATLCVKEKGAEQKFQLLDDRFLSTPSFAVARCHELTVEMAELSQDTLFRAMSLLHDFNESEAKAVTEAEDEVDIYEDKLGTYMVKLSAKSMSMADSRELSKLLHCIGDFERISDHAVNIMQTGEELYQKDLHFSDEAISDLKVMYRAIQEIVDMAVRAFDKNDVQLARNVEPLEQVIDQLKAQLKARHIARLQRGECTTLLGFVFSDLITNYERVADHCSNIAVCMIEVSNNSFDTHEYLNTLKSSDDHEFTHLYTKFAEKYQLS